MNFVEIKKDCTTLYREIVVEMQIGRFENIFTYEFRALVAEIIVLRILVICTFKTDLRHIY